MTQELTKADRERIEQLARRLEDEGATIEDIQMEAVPPEMSPVGEYRRDIEFVFRGRIERTD